mmetsp:Transcript_85618/g.167519  ORF Transcript_85618/g.167519 Transcript_85618/m.167519 type:complete len:347 (+) Transcript_85618:1-1041(+)
MDFASAGTWPLSGDFAGQTHRGFGVMTVVEMYQCTEDVTTKKSGQKSIKEYTYRTAWSASAIDDSRFAKKSSQSYQTNCGVSNPSWDQTWLPEAGLSKATSVQFGSFTLSGTLLGSIAVSTQWTNVTLPSTARQWTKSDGYFVTKALRAAGANTTSPAIGDVRVSFFTEDQSGTTYTAIGRNDAGSIGKWKASSSWGCGGNTLHKLSTGSVSQENMFAELRAGTATLKWILRFLGFATIWFALSRCAQPCGVLADVIPFIGDGLSSFIESLACCITCCPALACCMGVASVVYVAMRPVLGVPMLLFFLITLCAFVAYKVHKGNKKKKAGSADAPPPSGVGKPTDTE